MEMIVNRSFQSSWKRDKLFRLSDLITSGGTPQSGNESYYDGDIYWVQSGDLNDGLINDTEKKITEDGLNNSSAKIFLKGTFLVAMYGATIGKLGILTMDAATNQACCAIVPSGKINTRFLFYYFLSIKDDLIRDAYGGGQSNISQSIIKQLYLLYPAKEEQTAIANYLYKACADIDRVIEIKEEQLQKTEKLFFSFLNEIFTVEATVDWLVDRLKDVTTINPSIEEVLSDETPVTVVPMEAVSEMGGIDASEVVAYKDCINGLNYFRNGDVLFAKITPCMENGKGAYVENLTTQVAFGSTEFFVIRPSGKVLGKFIYYYTRAERYRLEAEANMKGAAGQQRVTPRFFYTSIIRFPKSIKEQERIVNSIEEFKERNNRLLDLLRNQIDALRNYKKSLIHEVVTGKKQVYFEESPLIHSAAADALTV